jgi:RNA polymerase sigma-70 factor (ECF subfamily)
MQTSESLPSDESLVTSALGDGGPSAFGHLVRRYERAVRATCMARLQDHHLACDAAQETFVSAYRSLASLRNRAAFGAWVITIARNRAIHCARKRRAESPLTTSSLIEQPAPKQNDHELLAAVASLPEHERVVVMLRYFENHEVAEIAIILGRPVGTVTKQLSRAHRRLRRALDKEIAP